MICFFVGKLLGFVVRHFRVKKKFTGNAADKGRQNDAGKKRYKYFFTFHFIYQFC